MIELKKSFIYIVILCNAMFFLHCQSQVEYIYPIQPGSSEWKTLQSHQEKVDACQLPDFFINTASTNELLKTSLKYPLFGDIVAFNSIFYGYDVLVNDFNGLQEFLRKNDSHTILYDNYKEMIFSQQDIGRSLQNQGMKAFQYIYFEVILCDRQILSKYSLPQVNSLLQLCFNNYNYKLNHPQIFGGLNLKVSCVLMARLLKTIDVNPFADSINLLSEYEEFLKSGTVYNEQIIEKVVSSTHNYLLKTRRD
jgi:hypothetical protein